MSDFKLLIAALEAKSLASFPACLDEWYCSGYEHCELSAGRRCACGKAIRHVYEITNRDTKERIEAIGSTCIEQFEPRHAQGLLASTKSVTAVVRRAKAAAKRAGVCAERAVAGAQRTAAYWEARGPPPPPPPPPKNSYAHVAKWRCFFTKHKDKLWGDLVQNEKGYCNWLLEKARNPTTKGNYAYFKLNPHIFGYLVYELG